MKTSKYNTTGILAAAALLLAGSAQIQAIPNLVIYSSSLDLPGTQGGQPDEYTGLPGTGGCTVQNTYASSTIWWDGTHSDPANDGGGSIYVVADFVNANNTCLNDTLGFDYDNWYYNGNGTVDFSQYTAITFDIMWDPNSTLTISQFNTGINWPLSDFLYSWQDTNFIEEQGLTTGVEIDCMSDASSDSVFLGDFSIPQAAYGQWVSVTIPYSDTISGISTGSGIYLHKYFGGNWGLATNPAPNITGAFWIDNVTLVAPVVVTPPPKVTVPTKAVPGLNVFASTSGLYDRQEAMLVANSGLSWVGSTSGGAPTYPVSYSLTLDGFPTAPAQTAEAYLFLIPNPAAQEGAPDYNESNALVLGIQATTNGGQGNITYKVNEPGGQNMYYGNAPYTNASGSWPGAGTIALSNWFETGVLTNVQSTKLLGTWTLQFSSATSAEVIGPDGTTSSFTIPSYYTSYFKENGSTATAFNIYLGMQANNSNALNQAVVYGSFSLTNVGGNFSENFVGETTLNLANWNPDYATGRAGVLIVPTTATSWIGWTLPASGFVLSDSASLSAPNWNSVTTFTPVPMNGENMQLLSPASDYQSPTNQQYFAMVKRVYNTNSGSLLVAMPGQTFVEGVGITGTPTPIHGSGNWTPSGPVYVYAVDSSMHLVSSVTDGITLYSGGPDADAIAGDFLSDGGSGGLSANMVGGIATFNNSFATDFSWGNAGLTAPATETLQVLDYTLQALYAAPADDPNEFNSSPISLVTP